MSIKHPVLVKVEFEVFQFSNARYATRPLVFYYLGYKKCYLVSHDWGGAVAWMVATKYPEVVEKLIACNIPNPFAFKKYMEANRSQFLKSW